MGYKQYCKDYENIENYQKAKADNFKGWNCHHRLETHNLDGERRLVDITKKELKALNMYYNRPAEELIFMTIYEHIRLHHKGKHRSEEAKNKMREAMKGKPKSEESKKKMGEAKKGEKNPNYGRHHSEETKNKMREAMKGNKYALGCKRSEETKKKLSEINKGNTNTKGMHWYNNGKINTMAKECPPGFIPGRITNTI